MGSGRLAVFAVATVLAWCATAVAADLRYVELLTGEATRGETLPLIVAMHGLGDRPEDFSSLFEGFEHRARIICPRAPKAWGPGYSWFDAPGQSGATADEHAAEIAAVAAKVAALIDELIGENPAPGRAIVTGFSQGAMLSYALAALHPEQVALSVPVAGLLPAAIQLPAKASAPLPRVLALHGVRDARVDYEAARSSIERLREAGYPASLSGYVGVGHTVSPPMRRELFAALAAAFEVGEPTAAHDERADPPDDRNPLAAR